MFQDEWQQWNNNHIIFWIVYVNISSMKNLTNTLLKILNFVIVLIVKGSNVSYFNSPVVFKNE